MAGLYGHAWTSAYTDDPRSVAGAEWAKTLAGLSRAQIEHGIDACRIEGQEWPPSAPRFRAMCMGIPPFERVRLDMTRSEGERSAFTRSVWQLVDGYAYRHASVKDAEKLLREAYGLAREMVMSGTPLPPPVAGQIEHQAPLFTPATAEQRRAHLDEIRRELGLPAAGPDA